MYIYIYLYIYIYTCIQLVHRILTRTDIHAYAHNYEKSRGPTCVSIAPGAVKSRLALAKSIQYCPKSISKARSEKETPKS